MDGSTALKTTMYVLLVSASVGASKSGADVKVSAAEVVLCCTRENFNRSPPPSIEIVALSLVVIEPTDVEFSATLKDSAEGKSER